MTIVRIKSVIERLVNDRIIGVYNVDGWEWRRLEPIEKENGKKLINFNQNSLYVLEGVFDNYFYYNGEWIHDPWDLDRTV